MHSAKIRYSGIGYRMKVRQLPLEMRYMIEHKPIVITIVGAESSGKTTLAMHLAEYFGCPWVPEYAREYLEALGRTYGEEDLDIIADRQLETILTVVSSELSVVSGKTHSAPNPLKGAKDEFIASSNFLKSKIIVVDGGMMTLKMWAKIKYHKSIQIVEEALSDDITDLYLLCRPHKEWTPDPLREAPSAIERVWIFNQYLAELAGRKTLMELVKVEEGENLEKTILNIEKFLNENFSK